MAVGVQNIPRKTLGQNPICSMPHFTGNYSPCWNSNEQPLSQTLSKNLSLRVESSPQRHQELGPSVHQLQDQGSPSTQSSSQSPHEVTAMGKANSQDQCVSSESDQIHQKHAEEQMKAPFFAPIPYAYADPYFLLNAYGPPQTIIQPQAVGISPARIPLPPDVTQDNPIYVNARQYHGILRRRQMRAKLEAQSKLVKNRKPYLHESRHLHALNRVRGSGGRFLSTKKQQQQQSDPTPSGSRSASVHSHQHKNMLDVAAQRLEANEHAASNMTDTAAMGHTNGDLIFQQSKMTNAASCVSSQMSASVPGTRGFVCYGSQEHALGFR